MEEVSRPAARCDLAAAPKVRAKAANAPWPPGIAVPSAQFATPEVLRSDTSAEKNGEKRRADTRSGELLGIHRPVCVNGACG